MVIALIIFLITYALMLAFQQYRPYIALTSAAIFIILGYVGMYDFDLISALSAVDYNVLLMIGGTMGTVTLFIESRMPARLAELLISKVPNVKWAVCVLALFAGIISAFVDNVATVLMVAPVGLAISRKLNISPVPVLISIAVSSNLQGAATLVGDTTSILMGGYADMTFLDFFWMQGKPGIFWGVEAGALVSLVALLILFRKDKQPVSAKVETEVTDYLPSVLMIGTVVCLIIASFVPEPAGGALLTIYNLRSGLICLAICIIGVVAAIAKQGSSKIVLTVVKGLDKDTLLLLFGLFMVIEGITVAGVIDAIADLFYNIAGDSPFMLYTLIVFASVLLSAFIDNIPYVATMLPVVTSIAATMGVEPYVFYFGLLSGATLGGNLTPIGASANITAIGILRKNGELVKVSDFLRIGLPFTLSAVITGYIVIWVIWGI
ncbi:MAG: SLC13 family permease [Anaerovoracaceae bacterium]